jgi:nucleoid DNA-binding protein
VQNEGVGPMATSTKKNTMTKKKLINSISQDKGIHPNDVRHVIQAFLDKITDCLSQGERLEFREFGVFEVVVRKQKIGRNPKNAAVPIVIPARMAVKFTPGKKMRQVVETEPQYVGAELELGV